jgi:hypothetical protein
LGRLRTSRRPRPACELVGVRGAARHRRKTGDTAMEARAGYRKIDRAYTLTHFPPISQLWRAASAMRAPRWRGRWQLPPPPLPGSKENDASSSLALASLLPPARRVASANNSTRYRSGMNTRPATTQSSSPRENRQPLSSNESRTPKLSLPAARACDERSPLCPVHRPMGVADRAWPVC